MSLAFANQAAFFQWVNNNSEDDCEDTEALTLHVRDLKLSALLDPTYMARQPTLTASTLYEEELQRLDYAIQHFPNLRFMTIIPPKPIHSHLLRRLYLSFLDIVANKCPNLENLLIYDDPAVSYVVPSLDFVYRVTYRDEDPIRMPEPSNYPVPSQPQTMSRASGSSYNRLPELSPTNSQSTSRSSRMEVNTPSPPILQDPQQNARSNKSSPRRRTRKARF